MVIFHSYLKLPEGRWCDFFVFLLMGCSACQTCENIHPLRRQLWRWMCHLSYSLGLGEGAAKATGNRRGLRSSPTLIASHWEKFAKIGEFKVKQVKPTLVGDPVCLDQRMMGTASDAVFALGLRWSWGCREPGFLSDSWRMLKMGFRDDDDDDDDDDGSGLSMFTNGYQWLMRMRYPTGWCHWDAEYQTLAGAEWSGPPVAPLRSGSFPMAETATAVSSVVTWRDTWPGKHRKSDMESHGHRLS